MAVNFLAFDVSSFHARKPFTQGSSSAECNLWPGVTVELHGQVDDFATNHLRYPSVMK
jgi:hypothetical protein